LDTQRASRISLQHLFEILFLQQIFSELKWKCAQKYTHTPSGNIRFLVRFESKLKGRDNISFKFASIEGHKNSFSGFRVVTSFVAGRSIDGAIL
jgi:hypothetical protein